MIKRSLYFGNPAYLSIKMRQLVINIPRDEDSGATEMGTERCDKVLKTIPIEDIGIIVLDNPRITITHALTEALLENNCALITCDSRHLPVGLLLPLYGNKVQAERYQEQINASLPLKKQLWQQTIQTKIRNQAAVLAFVKGEQHKNMLVWADSVRSGDSDNLEARAAAYYWKTVFPDIESFIRGNEDIVNILLNYGYSILRAMVARALVGVGLIPTLGIHHHNRYDAYCLADDIMEPYRPYVDKLVSTIIGLCPCELNRETKAKLLGIATMEVVIDAQRRPLMVAISQTASSLRKCFSGEIRKIIYPVL